jgi:uncharacterized protein (DUF488 family)
VMLRYIHLLINENNRKEDKAAERERERVSERVSLMCDDINASNNMVQYNNEGK